MIRVGASSRIDAIYAHTVESGVAGISESVAGRAGLKPSVPPQPPKPTPPSGALRLRVIHG